MKFLKYHSLILLLLCTVACINKHQVDNSPSIKVKPSSIVFIDISFMSRGEVASVIDKTLKSEAEVIGVLPTFTEWNNSNEDSLLLKAIKNQRVILASYIEGTHGADIKFITPNPVFLNKQILNEGAINYLFSNDSTLTHFVPLSQNEVRQRSAFPFAIAERFNFEVSDRMDNFKINQPEQINIKYDSTSFPILNKNFITKDIKGKIVILEAFKEIGGSSDVWILHGGKPIKTNIAVVTANIIMQYLNNE